MNLRTKQMLNHAESYRIRKIVQFFAKRTDPVSFAIDMEANRTEVITDGNGIPFLLITPVEAWQFSRGLVNFCILDGAMLELENPTDSEDDTIFENFLTEIVEVTYCKEIIGTESVLQVLGEIFVGMINAYRRKKG